MARLMAMELDARGIRYEYLHGNVPQTKRNELIERFWDESDCRIFLSTDTGSTGLNLQTASILINLDLPWNPAILEQRIGRIYRIGQDMPVQVLNLVSKDSIEESMIDRLRFKRSMMEGVLDGGDDTILLRDDRFQSFIESLFPALSKGEKEEEQEAGEHQTHTNNPPCPSPHAPKESPSPFAPSPEITGFLTSLRDILQSPDKSKQLLYYIDEILNNK